MERSLCWEALSASVALNGAAASLAVAALGLTAAGWPADGGMVVGNGAGTAVFALLNIDSRDPFDPMVEPCPQVGPVEAPLRRRIAPLRARRPFALYADFGGNPVLCLLIAADGTVADGFLVSATGNPVLDNALLASARRLPWLRPRRPGWVRVVIDGRGRAIRRRLSRWPRAGRADALSSRAGG